MQIPKKNRVLIAEDNTEMGLLLKFVFSSRGFEPILVSDAEEALESIEHQSFDALLTDIEMPGKDGITLIKDVRTHEHSRNAKHIPIMVLSGRPDRFDDALQAGAASCFSKSLADLAEIVEKMKELIQGAFISQSLCGAI
jgi:CheY-like chemotaxis protein